MKHLNFLIFVLIMGTFQGLIAQKLDMERFKDIKPRSVGPAGMSGRVTAIDVVLQNPNIMYVGTASGGLWKSTSGGIDWKPIFDKEKVISIGAIAIHQANPDIIWVGTGEGNPRNSQSSGAGIYRSLDGGNTWQMMGLEKTRNIHRIIIHPQNPQIVYVGVQGSAWGEHPERGVFKTTDGGKTWNKILFQNEKTGVADMVIDPSNPNKLWVAMWEFKRQPWFFKSGGEGSGLFVTQDGGDNWKRLTEKEGLPKGDLGRIGLSICYHKPEVMYALIESKKNGIYRSDDGGKNWRLATDKGDFGDRPFYYAEIYVDPSNENRLYSLYSRVSVSEDGGKNWKQILPYFGPRAIHPDHHAWWIHPNDPNFMIDGNDGGMAITRDMGKTWQFVENLPVAQYYHINVDMEMPYNIYGGMQDNGSWKGPAYTWRQGGIKNFYFEELAFGDGFDVVPDPTDNQSGYAMSQQGYLVRYNLATGSTKLIRPIHPADVKLRFNWNAALAIDPFDKSTIYYGSQFIHKSTDKGENWTIISPDLTTNDPEKQKQGESGGLTYDATGAENHTTIIAIAPSPIQKDLIWAGTDDGNLQITQDGGKTWTNLSANLKGVPKGSWIPQIQASKFNAGEAFVIINNYRRNDWSPFLMHTKDFGKTWRNLVDANKVWGYTLSVVQDIIEPKLLFLGTEFGLYFSIDGGESWTQWTNEYPNVSTYDMTIHPREHDLVIGTFGRSAYILDDIRPLRELAQKGKQILDKPIYAFATPDAVLAEIRQPAGGRFPGHHDFQGDNRPFGAMLSFGIKELKSKASMEKNNNTEAKANPQTAKSGEKSLEPVSTQKVLPDTLKVTVEIFNSQNQKIRTLQITPKEGINRFQWNLTQKGIRTPNQPKPRKDAPEPQGLSVLPGIYKIRYTYGSDKDSTTVKVIADPRLNISETDMKANHDLAMRMMNNVEKITEMVWRLNEANEIAGMVMKDLNENKAEDEKTKALKKQGKAIQDSINAFKEMIIGKQGVQGIFRSADILTATIGEAQGYMEIATTAPNSTQKMVVEKALVEIKRMMERLNTFFEKDWTSFQKNVEESKFSIFKPYSPIKID